MHYACYKHCRVHTSSLALECPCTVVIDCLTDMALCLSLQLCPKCVCALLLLFHPTRTPTLHAHQTVMQVEFALLFDLRGELIVVPGDPDLRGQKFDPAGIVNATLQNGIGYTRTGLLAASELRRFNCSKWNDRELQTTPTSALHPFDTGAEALVSASDSAIVHSSSNGSTVAEVVRVVAAVLQVLQQH
jgi:hypothetical protein